MCYEEKQTKQKNKTNKYQKEKIDNTNRILRRSIKILREIY